MSKYTANITINITEIQAETLSKLRSRKVKIGDFIRKAIQEKLLRDANELMTKIKKEYCPY